MTFERALTAMRMGNWTARSDWITWETGHYMFWIKVVDGTLCEEWPDVEPRAWTPDPSDFLATDWTVVDRHVQLITESQGEYVA